MSFKGIFCPPRRLVTEATRRLCGAVKAANPPVPVKFLLMNTAGNLNADLQEQVSGKEKAVLQLLRSCLPPHADNEEAAEFLRTEIGRHCASLEWIVIRPDTLLGDQSVTSYELHPSPTRSAILDPGQTSRINVAYFMTRLIVSPDLWETWKFQMPVIYNTQRNESGLS